MKDITPERAEQILAANLSNIIARLKSGKTLTAAEKRLFEEHTTKEDGPREKAKNITAMAKRLGVTVRTLQRWKKKYPDCPQNLIVSDWLKFKDLVAGVGRESEQYAARRAKAEAERAELAVEKLTLEIAEVKGELQARTEVHASGQRVGQLVRTAMSRLERDLAARLEGLTPEARRVAVREAIAETITAINEGLSGVGEPES
jgi:hypothetical protein